MNVTAYMAQADAEAFVPVMDYDTVRRGKMGLSDSRVASLRCFQFYSPNAFSRQVSPDGRQRWLGPKTSAVYAILHRVASSGEKTTMREIAGEAMCTPSTVSRAVQRLQAWGFFAIDITRGRHGGITVRMRRAGDALKHYAAAAWGRIKGSLNVASRSPVPEVTREVSTYVVDATFTTDDVVSGLATWDEYWAQRGGWPMTEADRKHEALQKSAREFARQVIVEIGRLEPDWDDLLEKARARWLK